MRALFFYMPEHKFSFNSCYRCSACNQQKGRSITNHHGKAVDIDVAPRPGQDRRDDMDRCDRIRGRLIEIANAHIGWTARNRKALEPREIAPTWVRYDVRTYESKYLDDKYFCTTNKDLDDRRPIKIRVAPRHRVSLPVRPHAGGA